MTPSLPMKQFSALLVSTVGLAGCNLLPLAPSPIEPLHLAYVAMVQGVQLHADEYDAADMHEARQRYVHAVQIRDSDPATAARLAEESEALAELAQAKAKATVAWHQRKAALEEIATIEKLAHPNGGGR